MLKLLAIGLVFAASSLAAPFCANAADDGPAIPAAVLASLPELSDIVEGSPTAPSTIIEYASLTCTHCAAFHANTWPALKAKYLDSGKAKFILREFPLDPRAAAGFLLARCAGPDKRDEMVGVLLDQQKDWAFVDEALEPLRKIAAPFGLAGADFDDCVHNQTLYMEINEGRDNAIKTLDIRRTPTFYVNGRKLEGDAPLKSFDLLLALKPE